MAVIPMEGFVRHLSIASLTCCLAAVFLLDVAASGVASATLLGDEFSQNYYYPDATTPYSGYSITNGTMTVPFNGTIGVVEDVTTLVGDLSATNITITLETTLTNPTWNSAPFNGLIFALVAPLALDITGAVIDPATTMAGFDLSRVTFNSDSIGLNWNGLSYTNGTVVSVDFTFPVPEPSSLALFVSALIGLGAGCTRKPEVRLLRLVRLRLS